MVSSTGSRLLRARRSLQLTALATVVVSAAGTARAQQAAGFAVDRFEPAGAGSTFLWLESLDFEGHLRPAARLVGAWAWKPLVVYDGQVNEVAPLVRQALVQHVQGSIVVWDRARLDLDLPVPLSHTGSDVVVGTQVYGAPEGAGIGDLRLGADVRLFGRPWSRLTGGAGAQVFLPTGSTKAFTSDGGVRFWPRVMLVGRPRFLVAGESDRLTWAARVGLHVRPEHTCACDLSPGSEVTAGLGATWRFSQRWAAGPEIYLATAMGGRFASRAGTSAELLLAGHVAVAPGWSVNFGLAPGLADGAGTPVARAIVGVQYVVAPAPAAIPAAPPAPEPATSSGATP